MFKCGMVVANNASGLSKRSGPPPGGLVEGLTTHQSKEPPCYDMSQGRL